MLPEIPTLLESCTPPEVSDTFNIIADYSYDEDYEFHLRMKMEPIPSRLQ
jgi:hypothetical protein